MKNLLSFSAISFICVSFVFATVQDPPKGNNNNATNANTNKPKEQTAKTNDFKGTSFGDISKSAAPADSTKKAKNKTSEK